LTSGLSKTFNNIIYSRKKISHIESSEKEFFGGTLECEPLGLIKEIHLFLNGLKVKLSSLGGYTPAFVFRNLTF
jgi:hypothetical protein